MTTLIISCIVAWIIGSALLLIVLGMIRGWINQRQERFERGERWTKEELDAAEAGAKEMKKNLWDDYHE